MAHFNTLAPRDKSVDMMETICIFLSLHKWPFYNVWMPELDRYRGAWLGWRSAPLDIAVLYGLRPRDDSKTTRKNVVAKGLHKKFDIDRQILQVNGHVGGTTVWETRSLFWGVS